MELYRGRNIHQLAVQMGTSVGMLEQHYSKLTPMLLAEQFAGTRSKKDIAATRVRTGDLGGRVRKIEQSEEH
jgi:hypothetical protein